MWGKTRKRQAMDMTRGSIAKQFIAFSIPLLIGNLFQQLYNMADSIIVGNCNGAEALAAVGTSGLPMDVMLAVFLGFSAAATIMAVSYTHLDVYKRQAVYRSTSEQNLN